jgi:hypothetical protein
MKRLIPKHLPQKDKEFIKQSLIAGDIFMAAYFNDSKRLKKLGRRAKRQHRRRLMLERQNPTPLLRELRRDAERFIKQEGRKRAYLDALEQARWYRSKGEMKLARKYWLLARVITKTPGKKKVTGKTYFDKLVEEYGTTDAMSARGFILPDGSCLNLGQYDDHRIIVGVYRNSTKAEQKYGSRYGAFKALCK